MTKQTFKIQSDVTLNQNRFIKVFALFQFKSVPGKSYSELVFTETLTQCSLK